MRLNKYLSDAGVCSRREADRLTEAGEITVNGKRAETGMQVESGDVVVVKGKTVVPEEKKVYLAFNKPRGIVCTAEKREKNNMKPLRNSIHKFLKSAEVTFFEGLYRDYFTRTLFFAQQYLPDPEEAREIAQETFVTLWEKRTEIRPDLSVQAFILTIAKHKCLNVLRKKIAEQKYSDSLTARETMANYSALSDETFDTVQMQELEQIVQDFS